jgi:hypothetical protein
VLKALILSAVRLRIIDPNFQGMDHIEREPEIWQLHMASSMPGSISQEADAVTHEGEA